MRFQPCFEQLEDRQTPSATAVQPPTLADMGTITAAVNTPVPYLHGPVIQNVRVVTVFWGNAWQTNPILQQQSRQLDTFFATFSSSTYMDMLSEYGIGRGSFWTHVNVPLNQPVNTGGVPGEIDVNGQVVHDMLVSAINDPSSPMPVPDANTLYMVFMAPNIVDPSMTGAGGWHCGIGFGDPVIPFGVMPYPSNVADANRAVFDTLTRVSSHEMAEAITDPYSNGWNNLNVAELGDMAYALPGDPNGWFAGYNVQSIWSNQQMTRVLPVGVTWDDPSVAGATSIAAAAVPVPANLVTVAGEFSKSDDAYMKFVSAAYKHYLGRTPAQAEVAGWVQLMHSGMTDEQVEAAFVGSPEYIQAHGGTAAAWVKGMYQDLLGRTPGQIEVNGWLRALQGGASPAAVAFGFAHSAEREGIRVQNDYQKYLQRSASLSEVAGWVNGFETGGLTNEDVVAGFVGSAEYFARQHNNPNLWLETVYQDVLGRQADVDGFEGWRALV